MSFDDTIKKIIYEEGVYPTHGTRPIFSTVHEIVKSRFPNIIRYICENNLKDRVYKIQYTFNDETNLIVINLYDIYGFAISNIKFEINETYEGDYYILANYIKEDIYWNSLWNKIRFDNLDEAKEYCEKLNIKSLKLLKADI